MLATACDSTKDQTEEASQESLDEFTAAPVALRPGERVTNHLAEAYADLRARTKPKSSFSPFVNADPVRAADYPWQVSLQVSANGAQWPCGGILVNRQYILTAAHCIDPRRYDDFSRPPAVVLQPAIEVRFGSNRFGQGQELPLDPTWIPALHPDWKRHRQPFAFDAALLRLAAPFTGATPAPVRSIEIAPQPAVVSGWGHFGPTQGLSDALRAALLPVVDRNTCAQNLAPHNAALLTDSMLCAVSDVYDACYGDSGGPLVIGSRERPQTVGVVSWGPSTLCTERGPRQTLVGLYAKGAAIAAWVSLTTGDPATVTAAPPDPTFAVRTGNLFESQLKGLTQ